MAIQHQNNPDTYLEVLMTESFKNFRELYGDPNIADPRFVGMFLKDAVKSKFIVTIKHAKKKEMEKTLKDFGRYQN